MTMHGPRLKNFSLFLRGYYYASLIFFCSLNYMFLLNSFFPPVLVSHSEGFLFMYLFLAVLGLCCCVWAFIVVAHRLKFCMWNLS